MASRSCSPLKIQPLSLSALLIALLLWAPSQAEALIDIDVLYHPEKASHRAVFERFESRLQSLTESKAVYRLRTFPPDTARRQDYPRAALVVTIGVDAALAQTHQADDTPVLSTLIPRSSYNQLSNAFHGQHTAIVLDQPLIRQLALARALIPQARTAGLLLGEIASPEVSGHPEEPFGFRVNSLRTSSDADPAAIIEKLLAANDVILSTFDPDVYTPAMAKWLLYLAFQKDRPIVGFSSALLEAGAVASVFSTPEQIGAHAAELVHDWLAGHPLPQSATPPRHYHIGVNAPVAASLGLGQPSRPEIERIMRELLGSLH